MKDQIVKFIYDELDVPPEHLWRNFPDYAVWRREDNRKWFAVIMNVDRVKLGLDGGGKIEIINVKADSDLIADLKTQPGYSPAYHMNKNNWVTILLDGTVMIEEVQSLILNSYETVASNL